MHDVEHGTYPPLNTLKRVYAKQKTQLKAAVETMISWNPERIILAHGRWYPSNGTEELRRAFRWVLKQASTGTVSGLQCGPR